MLGESQDQRDRVLLSAYEKELVTVYEIIYPMCTMWWFLLYYVTMHVPPGLVETSFVDNVIRVGDQVHVVEEGHSIECVQKRGSWLKFTLEEHSVVKT